MANVALYKNGNNVWIYKDGKTDDTKSIPASTIRFTHKGDYVSVYGANSIFTLFQNVLVTDIESDATGTAYYASLAAFETATAEVFLKASGGGGGAIDSVFGRSTPDILAVDGDYSKSLITGLKDIDSVNFKSQILTVPVGGNSNGLIVNQNDITNNPNGLEINNAGSGDSININTTDFIVKNNGFVGIGVIPTTKIDILGSGNNAESLCKITNQTDGAISSVGFAFESSGGNFSYFGACSQSYEGPFSAFTHWADRTIVVNNGGTGTLISAMNGIIELSTGALGNIQRVIIDNTGEVTVTGNLTAQRKIGTAITGTTYTFALTDRNQYIRSSNASAQAITVPTNASVAFPIGTEIEIIQADAGQVSFVAGGGVTINSKNSYLKLDSQFSAAVLKKVGTDEWDLIGDLTA